MSKQPVFDKKIDNYQKYIIHCMLMEEDNPLAKKESSYRKKDKELDIEIAEELSLENITKVIPVEDVLY